MCGDVTGEDTSVKHPTLATNVVVFRFGRLLQTLGQQRSKPLSQGLTMLIST